VQPEANADEVAWLMLDVSNFLALEIETDLGTATECDIIGQLGTPPAPFDSVSVVGAANDTETSSLHGKIGTDTEMADQSLFDMTRGGEWRLAISGVLAAPSSLVVGTVTGLVEAQFVGVVTAAITGTLAETLTLTADVTTLIAATTATDLALDEIWHDATPDAKVELSSVLETYLISGQDIVLDQSGVDAWDTGGLDIIMRWRPVGRTGKIVAT